MRGWLGLILGGITGFAVGVALVLALISAREPDQPPTDPAATANSSQEAIHVFLAMILVPLATTAGIAFGLRIAQTERAKPASEPEPASEDEPDDP